MRKLILTVVSGLVIFFNTYGEIKVKKDMQLVKEEGEKEVSLKEVSAEESSPGAKGKYIVKKEHPRIFLTKERLARLKAEANANEPLWQILRQKCDTLLTYTPHTPDDVFGTVRDGSDLLALCYQITKEPKYAKKSIELILNYLQWLDKNFDFKSNMNSFPREGRERAMAYQETDYGNFRLVPAAIAFDWVYDQITKSDKEYFINMFNKCIDSAMVRKGFYGGAPSDNHAHTKNRTELFLGLATYEDNPRAKELIDTAYNRFVNEFMPLYNKYNVGGAIYMGSLYGYGRTLPFALYNVEAIRTSLSIDLYVKNTWFEDVIYYLIHSEAPKIGTSYINGTRAPGIQVGLENISGVRFGTFASFLKGHYADNISASYLEFFMNEKGIDIDKCEYAWLFRDKKISPKDYRLDLPPAYLSKGIGLSLVRSDWSKDALWFSLQGGDLVGDHQEFDMGHFTLFRGTRLVSNAGINRVLIGKQETRQEISYLKEFSPTGSQVEKFENTDNYAYTKIDLTRIYYGAEFNGKTVREKLLAQEVSKTTREAILLRPDYVILYDKTGTINNNIPTKWVVHLDSPTVNIENDTYSCSVDGNNLYIRTLLPNSINVTNEVLLYKYGKFAKLMVTPKTPIKDEIYLHIFYAPQKASTDIQKITKIDSENMVGAYVSDKVVLFNKTELPVKNVEYRIKGNGRIKNTLIDMNPDTTYTILKDGIEIQTVNSSKNGIVSFEIDLANEHQIKVKLK